MKYLAHAIVMAASALVQRAVGFLSTIVLAAILGPTQLGLQAVTTSTANTFYGLSRLGVDSGVHVLASGKSQLDRSTEISAILGTSSFLFLVIGALGAITCFLCAVPFSLWLFSSQSVVIFIQLGAALMFFQVISQSAYIAFAGLHAFRTYASVTIVTASISAVLICAGAYWQGAVGAASGLVIGQAITALALWARLNATFKTLGLVVKPRPHLDYARTIIILGFPFYLSGLVQIPADYLAQGLLVRWHTATALGDLRVVSSICGIILLIPHAISGPMVSSFSQAHESERAQYFEQVATTFKLVWIFGMAAAISLDTLWGELIRLLFGSSFIAAATYGHIAVITTVVVMMSGVIVSGLLAAHRSWLLFPCGIAQAILMVGISVYTIPSYALGGYLFAQLVSASVMIAITPVYLLLKAGQQRQHGQRFCFLIIGSVLIFTVLAFVHQSDAGVLIRLATGGMCMLLLGLASWRVILTSSEKDVALAMLGITRRL